MPTIGYFYSERIVMRNRNIIASIILFPFLAAMSACALDVDTDQPDEQVASEELSNSNPQDAEAIPSDTTEPNIAATPTCNWVASFAGAWIPFFSGASSTINCSMVKGTNSPGVRQLQHSMNVCYGEHLTEDGDFGQLTKDALIRTQRKAGTAADGEYGPNTRKAMLHEAVGGGPCVRVP